MNKVGLVILNYNDSKRTISLLKKIVGYDIWNKIIVVDNKSTDGSFAVLKKFACEKVIIIESERNGGYSYGNNFGAKYLIEHYDIDICVIANPDIRVSENVVRKMVKGIEENGYSAIAPIMVDAKGNYSRERYKCPDFYQDVREYLFPISIGTAAKYRKGIKRKKEILPVQMLPGSLFAISTEALIQIGFFDESVFLYCEERILAEKMRCRNLKMGVLQNEYFIHLHKETKDRDIRVKQMERVNSARMYYYQKYRNIGEIKIKILKISMKWYTFWYKRYVRGISRR